MAADGGTGAAPAGPLELQPAEEFREVVELLENPNPSPRVVVASSSPLFYRLLSRLPDRWMDGSGRKAATPR